jgi:hypothetical protein
MALASGVVGAALGAGGAGTGVAAGARGPAFALGAVITFGDFELASSVVGSATVLVAAGSVELDGVAVSLDGAGACTALALGAAGVSEEVALTSMSALASFGAACAETGRISSAPSEQQRCNNCTYLVLFVTGLFQIEGTYARAPFSNDGARSWGMAFKPFIRAIRKVMAQGRLGRELGTPRAVLSNPWHAALVH